ncbi:MAG: response regulator transcription factor [Halothermotrichaceae bacterium]
MFNMVIVDDEPTIRKGIKNSIDWDKYDINISAEAANGIEAVEKIREVKPEIVILDIRMPQLNGLEVCKKVFEKLPDLEIIILSGYDEFNYAKKAIELGVADYLLKPFGAEELVEKITKLKDKINRKKFTKKEIKLIHENSNELFSILINKIINQEDNLDSDCKDKLQLLGLDFSIDSFYPFIIDIDYYLSDEFLTKDKIKKVKNNLTKIFNSNYNDLGFLVPIINEKHLFGLLKSKSNDSLEKDIKLIKEGINNQYSISTTFLLGEKFADFKGIKSSYEVLESSIKAKFYIGSNNIINHPWSYLNKFKDSKEVNIAFGEFGELLEFMEKDKLKKRIGSIFEQFRIKKLEVDLVKHIIIKINNKLIDSIYNNRGTKDLIKIENIIKVINQIDTWNVLKNWQYQMINNYIDIIKNIRSNKYNRIVSKAIKYLKGNYQKNISLEMVSELVHVSPNYFSKIFKEETGSTFVGWLNKYRIEESKNILVHTDKSCSQIAEEVGYNDYRYFSYNFKKYTNMSPRKYRKNTKTT